MILSRPVILFALCLLEISSVAGTPPAISVNDGSRNLEPSDGSLTIAYSSKQLTFNIGNVPEDKKILERFKYQLKDVDADWQANRPIIYFTVGFYNKGGDRIALILLPVSGISAGWKSKLEDSTFTHRMERLTVPEGSQTVRLSPTSAGPSTAVGVYIVADVSLSPSSNGIFKRLPSSEWMPDGTTPSMAQLLTLPDRRDPEKALAILDSDPIGHAAWITKPNAIPVQPGNKITIEWNELYNIGHAAIAKPSYGPLKPGNYEFLAQRVDLWGQPVGPVARIPIRITPPYWKTSWFWLGVMFVFGASTIAVARYILRQKIRQHQKNMQLIEQERLRIARDLHDDLGARLTHLALMSARGRSAPTDQECRTSLAEISNLMRESVASLSHTVWAINPDNDNLDSLAAFLCRAAQMECKHAGIRFRISTNIEHDRRTVPSELRHQIVLTFKEAMNNIFKHANASEIALSMEIHFNQLEIIIKDNGLGFDMSDQNRSGNGLLNMRKRIESASGSVEITSERNQGTTVRIRIPIPNTKFPQ